MAKKNEIRCFSFYSGGPACYRCKAAKRCKAVFVSHGMEFTAHLLRELIEDLPSNGVFRDTDRIPVLVDQLLNPATHSGGNSDEAALLEALEGHGADLQNTIADLDL